MKKVFFAMLFVLSVFTTIFTITSCDSLWRHEVKKPVTISFTIPEGLLYSVVEERSASNLIQNVQGSTNVLSSIALANTAITAKVSLRSAQTDAVVTEKEVSFGTALDDTVTFENLYVVGDSVYAQIELIQDGYAPRTERSNTITVVAGLNTIEFNFVAAELLTYNIAYNLNGGTNFVNAPTTYTVATPTITLGSPTKAGCTFAGWYTNAGFTGNVITEIPQGTFGNINLWARFAESTNTLHFDVNGGSESINPIEVIFGQAIGILPVPTKEGSEFSGWIIDDTNIITENTVWNYHEDKTAIALWNSITKVVATLSSDNTVLTVTPTTDGTGDSLKAAMHAVVTDSVRPSITTITIEPASDGLIIPETDLSNLFSDNDPREAVYYTSLTTINGLEHIDTSNVKDMSFMFGVCSALTSVDLSSFNTSSVTNMGWMFTGCEKLTSLDLRSFDTSNVTYMFSMFQSCFSLATLNLGSNFNTANVTNMAYMFAYNSELTALDLSSFNTEKVEQMYHMFNGCSSLNTLDLSGFNTAQVTDMNTMFVACENLTSLILDDSFNTTQVANMSYMFYGCSALNTLNLSGFNTSNVTDSTDMFNFVSLDSITVGSELTKNISDLINPKSGMIWAKEEMVYGKTLPTSGNPAKAEAGTYTAKMAIDTVYLNGSTGDNTKSGIDVSNAVLDFNTAVSLLSEGGTIWIVGTVTVNSDQTWQKPTEWTGEFAVKRYDADASNDASSADFKGHLIDVTGGTLTLKNILIDGMGGVKYAPNITDIEFTGDGNVSAEATLINIEAGGSLIIESGTVLQNNKNTVSVWSAPEAERKSGGAIQSLGTVIMNDGIIQYNQTSSSGPVARGGGVYLKGGSSFTMNDGAITKNQARTYENSYHSVRGGGVYIDSASFTMGADATISDNIAYNDQSSQEALGGGIYVTGGTVAIEGSITNNKAYHQYNLDDCDGGGVYVAGSVATVNLKGNPRITGNEAKYPDNSSTVLNNLVFTNSETESPVKIDGALTDGASIGLSPSDTTEDFVVVEGVIPEGSSEIYSPFDEDALKFSFDTAQGRYAKKDGNNLKITAIGAGSTLKPNRLPNQSTEGVVFYYDGTKYYEVSERILNPDDSSDTMNWTVAYGTTSIGETVNQNGAAGNYEGGGMADWYLPNLDMLNRIYDYAKIPGHIDEMDELWSSSQGNYNVEAWYRRFDGIFQDYTNISNSFGVRAIRAFDP